VVTSNMYQTESTTKVSPRSSKGSSNLQFAQRCILELNRFVYNQVLFISVVSRLKSIC